MKKLLIAALLVASSWSAFSQHIATLTGKANFKNTSSGLVRLEFTLDKPMNESELKETFQWLEDNDAICVLEVDGVNVSISVVAESASRDVYDKCLNMMGVHTFVVPVGNEKKNMTLDEFFKHFQL
jgi:hypothetical protein